MPLGFLLAALLAMITVAVYFAPSLIALSRHADRAELVLAINILLGWTIVGWAGAMVLALRNQAPPSPVSAGEPSSAHRGSQARPVGGERPVPRAVAVPRRPGNPRMN